MPIFFKVVRIVGQVPSPTPTMPMASLSTNVIWRPRPDSEAWRAAMMPAVSHPAVPPPTMQIDRTGLTMVYFPIKSPPPAIRRTICSTIGTWRAMRRTSMESFRAHGNPHARKFKS